MKTESGYIRTKEIKQNLILTILFLILFSAPALDAIAQEEHHTHEAHRHMKYANMKNPVVMNAKSIAEGKQLYEKQCMACHGQAGKGGIGPSLTGPVRIHGNSDGEIFYVITDGVGGTAMKGFKKDLSENMRWNLVNYIKSLGKAINAK